MSCDGLIEAEADAASGAGADFDPAGHCFSSWKTVAERSPGRACCWSPPFGKKTLPWVVANWTCWSRSAEIESKYA